MFAMIKRTSCFENRLDASLEKFILHHKLIGFFMIFVGMPLITLAAVCACTVAVTMPLAFLFGAL